MAEVDPLDVVACPFRFKGFVEGTFGVSIQIVGANAGQDLS